MLLAGDVGGTKSDFALFDHAGGARAPKDRRQLPSRGSRLLEVVRTYLRAAGDPPVTAAAFAVAGPVVDGTASLVNLGWEVDAAALCRELDLDRVLLLNDLEATATAVPVLAPSELRVLRAGRARAGGAIGVIAPGTGLGEGFLTWDGQGYRVHASEGGHGDFAPVDAEQVALLQHLWTEMDHVSYERVCSGRGIPNLWDFLAARGVDANPTVDAAVEAARSAGDDPAPPIVAASTASPGCGRARAAIDLFLRILGAEAGNLALRVLATGGVYVAGGLPARVLDRFAGSGFLDAFDAKGRQAPLVADVPVHIVLEQVALYGAARRGLEVMPPQQVDR